MQINAQPSRRKINKTKKTQQRESTVAAPPLPQTQTHQNAIGRSSHENATQREGPKQKAEEIHASNGTSASPPRTAIVPYRSRSRACIAAFSLSFSFERTAAAAAHSDVTFASAARWLRFSSNIGSFVHQLFSHTSTGPNRPNLLGTRVT